MANTDGRTLGDVLRNARVAADLTLRDLAKKLNITPSYISDIENDRRVPSEDVLQRLAAELKLKFDELMARAGRVGDQAERYMKQNPSAGVLFRRISERRLPEEDLKKLLTQVEKMGSKKGGT
jgi:transcriptional regulator with XRE-family HTH domain